MVCIFSYTFRSFSYLLINRDVDFKKILKPKRVMPIGGGRGGEGCVCVKKH